MDIYNVGESMLGFFRKYQRFFFLIVTIVIVISFSFFGTQSVNTEPVSYSEHQDAFRLEDGTTVARGELDAMVRFLGTDALDAWIYGGAAGFNFLNNGFIRHDILDSGVAEIWTRGHLDLMKDELNQRLKGERIFQPYVHPAVRFVGVEQIWKQVTPELYTTYVKLRSMEDAGSEEAFAARVRLYLAESSLPQPLLKQFLVQQQRQYQWIPADPSLEQRDLALFGYHRVEDWFGQRFLHLVAQMTWRVAAEAERRGYSVSDEEVYTDLMHNATRTYQQLSRGATVSGEQISHAYAAELRQLGITEPQAIRIWKRVMLYRRLIDDVGHSVFVDSLLTKGFDTYASATVTVDQYQVPPALRMASFRKLQELQTYLTAVSNVGSTDLQLPTQYRAASEVPGEFVQKRYLVNVVEVDKDNLQSKVGVREAWAWQQDETNWPTILAQFPDLAGKPATTADERFAALEAMEPEVRSRVDRLARESVRDQHPEWVDNGLSENKAEKLEIQLLKQGGQPGLPGIKDNAGFASLLDEAMKGSETAKQILEKYTQDDQHFYRITVLDASEQWEVLTFDEAVRKGSVAALLDKQLQKHYEATRDSNPSYKNEKGEWKPLDEVSDQVAEAVFANLLAVLRKENADKSTENASAEHLARLRLVGYMKQVRDSLAGGAAPESVIATVEEHPVATELEKLPAPAVLADQWKVTRTTRELKRQQESGVEELLALAEGSFSQAVSDQTGNVLFSKVIEKGEGSGSDVGQALERAQARLGRDAIRQFMKELRGQVGALDFDYLTASRDA